MPLLLAEHDPHPAIYDRLRATMPILSTDRVEEHAVALLGDVLSLSGFLPDLGACAACGRPVAGNAAYSPTRPGLYCGDCAKAVPDRQPIDPRPPRLAPTLLNLPRDRGVAQRLPKLSRPQSDPLIDLFLAQIELTAQRPMRTRAFLKHAE